MTTTAASPTGAVSTEPRVLDDAREPRDTDQPDRGILSVFERRRPGVRH